MLSLANRSAPAGLRFFAVRAAGSTGVPAKKNLYTAKSDLKFDPSAFSEWPASRVFRNYTMFTLCQFSPIVKAAPQIMEFGNHVRNPLRGLFRFGMRLTAYGQFVGGETDEELGETCDELAKFGVEPMFAIPIEPEALRPGMDVEAWYDDNADKLVDCLHKAIKFAINHKPVVHIKISPLLGNDTQIKLGAYIGLDITSEEVGADGCSPRDRFERCVEDVVGLMKSADHICTELDKALNTAELEEFKGGITRLNRLAEAVNKTGTETLVDAEYINLNPALTVMTMALARMCNSPNRPLVGNTYQCYLKNAKKLVNYEIDYLRRHNCSWAAKLVRGAYMVSEAKRAKKAGYPNPVCDSKTDTHANYNSITLELIDRIEAGEPINICAASHNEETVQLVVQRLEELESNGFDVGDRVIFGQLYGMCEHVSSGLGKYGAPVYKAIPIGGITDVLPYLARRAQENQTVLNETHVERSHLLEALKDKCRK